MVCKFVLSIANASSTERFSSGISTEFVLPCCCFESVDICSDDNDNDDNDDDAIDEKERNNCG